MIQDTTLNLEVHLQRIDEKMTRFTIEVAHIPEISIDLNNERGVTMQCLRICEDARSYIESLTNRESTLLPEAPQKAVQDDSRNPLCDQSDIESIFSTDSKASSQSSQGELFSIEVFELAHLLLHDEELVLLFPTPLIAYSSQLILGWQVGVANTFNTSQAI